MKLNFKPKEIEEIIELYYQEFEGKTVKATTSYQAARLGYGMSEYDGCLVTFSISGTIELLGKRLSYEENLSEDDVRKIFEKALKKADFNVTTFSVNAGVSAHTSGYGMMERTENVSYFKGITIEGTKEKEKPKQFVYQKEGI